jgi:hypothetical protein
MWLRKSSDVSPDTACCVDASAQPVERRRRHLDEFVRDEPLTALAIAVTAGFILGGGAATRSGRGALGLVGRLALRGAVTNLLAGMLAGSRERRAKEFESGA